MERVGGVGYIPKVESEPTLDKFSIYRIERPLSVDFAPFANQSILGPPREVSFAMPNQSDPIRSFQHYAGRLWDPQVVYGSFLPACCESLFGGSANIGRGSAGLDPVGCQNLDSGFLGGHRQQAQQHLMLRGFDLLRAVLSLGGQPIQAKPTTIFVRSGAQNRCHA